MDGCDDKHLQIWFKLEACTDDDGKKERLRSNDLRIWVKFEGVKRFNSPSMDACYN